MDIEPPPGKDIFRDTPLRYLGYANEVGESFRAVVDVRLVHFSYVVASAYVLSDTASKSSKMWRRTKFTHDTNERVIKTAVMGIDVLLWQSFASVIIPGFVINRICAFTRYALKKTTLAPQARWASVGVGLVSIPFIIHPIDNFVTFAMDNTVRKIFGTPKGK